MSDHDKPFRDMADRIERGDPAEFAGAVVVVPPSGEPIAFMLTDPKPSLAQFWTGLQGRIDGAAAEAKSAQEQPGPYSFQRR